MILENRSLKIHVKKSLPGIKFKVKLILKDKLIPNEWMIIIDWNIQDRIR